MSTTRPQHQPLLTSAGMWRGAVLTLPTLPGVIAFAAAYGTAAAGKGLSFAEALSMSAFVFGGLSQMVAVEAWPEAWTWTAVLGLAALAFIVNSRMVLMGAAMHPWLSLHSNAFNALHLSQFTDVNWVIATRYHETGGRDLGVLVGSGLVLWFCWTLATVPGYLIGAVVSDPRRYALDLVLPVYFLALMVPMWKGFRPAIPWAVAGVVSLLWAKFVPGYGFIVAGSIAGALTGAFMPEPAAGGPDREAGHG